MSGTARSATSCISKRATATSATTSRCSPTATKTIFFHDTGQLYSLGAHQKQQLDRDRKQYNLAATYFLDTGKGSHTFKMGAELLKEQSWEGYESRRGGSTGIEQIYNNGVSSQVIFGIPTASCKVASLAAHDCLTARSALDQMSAFITDSWAVGRITINPGVRFDRYKGWLPEQEQLAGRSGPVVLAAETFPQTDFYTWNVFAPRIGAIFDLTGDGKMVIKANYGLYWHNPGVGPGSNANPNTASKSATYTWNDQAGCAGCINGDRKWQPGEEGASPTSAALKGAVGLDPNLKAPYSHEASVFVERQLSDTMGMRAGFVYKTEDDLISTYQMSRGPETYTVPYTFVDIGVDGIRGTGDDKNLQFYGFPTSNTATECVDRHQPRSVLALQDGRGLGEQALRQQVVGVDGRRLHAGRTTSRTATRRTRCSRAWTIGRGGASRRRVRTTHPGVSA